MSNTWIGWPSYVNGCSPSEYILFPLEYPTGLNPRAEPDSANIFSWPSIWFLNPACLGVALKSDNTSLPVILLPIVAS